jgi:hypothetical protein
VCSVLGLLITQATEKSLPKKQEITTLQCRARVFQTLRFGIRKKAAESPKAGDSALQDRNFLFFRQAFNDPLTSWPLSPKGARGEFSSGLVAAEGRAALPEAHGTKNRSLVQISFQIFGGDVRQRRSRFG